MFKGVFTIPSKIYSETFLQNSSERDTYSTHTHFFPNVAEFHYFSFISFNYSRYSIISNAWLSHDYQCQKIVKVILLIARGDQFKFFNSHLSILYLNIICQKLWIIEFLTFQLVSFLNFIRTFSIKRFSWKRLNLNGSGKEI